MTPKHPKATQPSTAQAQSPHTPGPWTLSRCQCGDPVCRQWFVSCARSGGRFDEADARLIAAAPEMLASLVGLMEAWDGAKSLLDLSERIPAIRAAIAKATAPTGPENGGGK